MSSTGSLFAAIQASGRNRNAHSNIKFGYISSYDPDTYAVRVRLEPESAANESRGLEDSAVETQWIPIFRPYGGNKWGYKAPPNANPAPPYGDQCLVLFPDGGTGMAFIGSYNNVENPYQDRDIGDFADPTDAAPLAGEVQIVHSKGSFLKFRNDGTVMIFAKPQSLPGLPGSALLYLNDNGTIELRDAENNFLKMFAKKKPTRISMTDVEGNYLRMMGGNAGNLLQIEMQDQKGNHVRLVGDSSTTRIAIEDISGNFIHMGPNVEHSSKIIISDQPGNRLEIHGSSAGSRIRLVSIDSHVLEFNTSGDTYITNAGGGGQITISAGGGLGQSGVVTYTHLAKVVAEIIGVFATCQSGSGVSGASIIAEASSIVSATD